MLNWQKLLWSALAVVLVMLQLALIAAKLLGHVQWAWWLILTPLWVPIVCAALAVVAGITGLANDEASGGNPFQ